MIKFIAIFAAAACLAVPMAAFGQSVPTTDSEPSPTEAEPLSPERFSAGESLAPSEERQEGDWTLTCFGTGVGRTCGMTQAVLNQEGTNVAQVEMFRLPDNPNFEFGAIVVTPLETWLEPGLILRIDNGDVHRYPYRYCFDQGCVVQLGLTGEQIDAMRLGLIVHLRIFKESFPDDPVDLQLSLAGFTKSMDEL